MNLPRKRLFMAMAAGDGNSAPIRPVMVLRPTALASNEYELIIYGDIGESWWGDSVTALSIVQQLQQLDPAVTQLNVRINSYGGSVSDGLAIHNALRRHSARKVGTIDGVAMSSASLIAMACDELKMPPESVLMIHAPWGVAQGNAQDMREMADILDMYADAMAGAYARKSGKPKAEMMALLTDGKDHYYSGDQALAAGFIDALVADPVEEDEGAAARAQGDIRAQGIGRFTDGASAQIQKQAMAAIRRQPKAMPASEKPRVRGASADDHTHFNLALGSAEGQQALLGALTTALAAETGDTEMIRRKLYAALREPVGPNGSESGGGVVTPPAPAAVADPTAAVFAAMRQRNDDVRAAFEPHLTRPGVQALLTTVLGDPSVTVDQARTNLLDHIGASASAVRVELVADESDKFRAAGENALLSRAGMAKADGQNPMRGMNLREMARASLQRAGRNSDGMDVREVVGAAFTSTSDFPALLTSTALRSLLLGYDESPEVFDQFTRTGTLTDFRSAARAGLGFFSSLDKIPEGAEYKMGTFGSAGNTIALATYGKLFAITRQAIINDDLGAFTDVPRKMGRAAKRTIGDLVFAVLTKNAVMADGKALFSTDHNNLINPGTTITTDAVAAMRVAMGTQTVDKRPVAVPLKKLIVPLALEGAANLVRSAQYRIGGNDNSTTPNVEQNRFDVIADARLDAYNPKGWFGSADPNVFDTIEVAYLDGIQQPFLDQKDSWNVDGTQYKVRIDAGVAPLDFRGLAKNPGTA